MSVSLIDGHIDREKQTMTDNEKNSVTDNEIIKAMEWCWGGTSDKCRNCPLEDTAFCEDELQDKVLDLIKRKNAKIKSFEGKIVIQNGLIDRQKAEIERLHKEVGYWEAETKESRADIDQAVAEAVKECLDKIEQMDVSESDNYIMVKKIEFDNLVKEMVGDTE